VVSGIRPGGAYAGQGQDDRGQQGERQEYRSAADLAFAVGDGLVEGVLVEVDHGEDTCGWGGAGRMRCSAALATWV